MDGMTGQNPARRRFTARPNSAGLPDLPSDAGQFTYHRSFRPDLVPDLARRPAARCVVQPSMR